MLNGSDDGHREGGRTQELTILYTRALTLLSRCSPYLPGSLVDEIERLAHDSTKAMLVVRVERSDGRLTIDPLNIPGQRQQS